MGHIAKPYTIEQLSEIVWEDLNPQLAGTVTRCMIDGYSVLVVHAGFPTANYHVAIDDFNNMKEVTRYTRFGATLQKAQIEALIYLNSICLGEYQA